MAKQSSSFEKWAEVIKNIEFDKRTPMWEQAITILVDEGVMGPTMAMELSQQYIQDIILENHFGGSITGLFVEFGQWLISAWGEIRFYVMRFNDGNELWLAYLMGVYYALEWNDAAWVDISRCPAVVESEGEEGADGNRSNCNRTM